MSSFIPLNLWWAGVVSYAACHLLHILLWNSRLETCGMKLLFTLFLGVPAILFFSFLLVVGFDVRFVPPLVVHFLLAANYISIYPALQASSPTLTLLEELYRVRGGISEKEILERYSHEKLVGERMRDLQEGKFLIKTADGLYLTRLGSVLAAFFILFRKLVGLPTGAG